MYVSVCILQECLLNVWKPMVLCLCKCVCVCILITHPVFWESSPWLRGRLWTKLLGKGWGKAFQKERLRDTPETWSPDMPFPFLETVSPSDSEGKMMDFSPHRPSSACPTLFPPRKKCCREWDKTPRGQKDWGKGYEGWRGNLQECPNGKATLNRMFS